MRADIPLPDAQSHTKLAVGLLAFVSLLGVLALWAPASHAAPVAADAVLLETEEGPWADEFNEEAMAAVFGTDWEQQEFGSVQADEASGGLFSPHVKFIWIEGSDGETEAAAAFIAANEAALKAFVARGGSLFIDSATNQSVILHYDGRSIGRGGFGETSQEVAAVDPADPIFNGPASPNATAFTGNSFAHGYVVGPELTPLIVNSETGSPEEGDVVLADYQSGAGHVALGTLTVVEFQEPEEAAKSLRMNLLSYLASLVPAEPTPEPTPVVPVVPVTPAVPVTPTAPVTPAAPATSTAAPAAVTQCTVPTMKGMRLKAARESVKAAHCALGKNIRRNGANNRNGKVVGQTKEAGTVLPAESVVRITLGKS